MNPNESVRKRETLEIFEIIKWILGRRNLKILKISAILQVLLCSLDFLFLSLVSQVITSLVLTGNEFKKTVVLHFLELSQTQAFLVICAIVGIKSLLNLAIKAWVLNSLADREAEVTLSFIQSSLLENLDSKQDSNTADLLQIYTSIIGGIFTNILKPLVSLIGEITTIIAIMIFLIFVQPTASIVLIIYFLIFNYFIAKRIGNIQSNLGRTSLQMNRESLRDFSEIILLDLELKLANREDETLLRLLKNRYRISRLSSKFTLIHSLPRYFLEFLLISGIATISGAQHFFHQSSSSISQLGLIIAAGFRVLPSINAIVLNFGTYKNTIPALYRLKDIGLRFGMADTPIEYRKQLRSSVSMPYSGDIAFQNVTYRYPGSTKDILTNFDFTIPFNKVTLIRGVSGSGKTTLLHLILGLLEPQSGEVLYFGNGSKIPASSNISEIRYVSQEVHLMDESFGHNITMRAFSEDDEARLTRVCQLVGIYDRIRHSDLGFRTLIGQNGKNLSAGERQRLGIARALFDSPSLIILDEPTANLDAVSEAQVWEALQNIKNEVTLIIVSHSNPPVTLYDSVLDLR